MHYPFKGTCSLDRLRKQVPLVQCITNDVAMNFAANVLTALGASPVMAFAPEEAATFTKNADCLTVNLGILTSEKLNGILSSTQIAKDLNKPIVLDPVAHFVSSFRQQAVDKILALNPTVIRGNGSEILTFSEKSSAKGVDSGNATEDSIFTAIELAKKYKTIVAVSGENDFITDGVNHFKISGGHPLMAKVSATGCALTCAVGAFVALAPDAPLQGTLAAFNIFSIAGKIVGESARGPSSFVPQFLDTLYSLNDEIIDKFDLMESLTI